MAVSSRCLGFVQAFTFLESKVIFRVPDNRTAVIRDLRMLNRSQSTVTVELAVRTKAGDYVIFHRAGIATLTNSAIGQCFIVLQEGDTLEIFSNSASTGSANVTVYASGALLHGVADPMAAP